MNDRILADHIARYPKAEAQDFLKLAYQSKRGAEHLIAEPEKALSWLARELDKIGDAPHPAEIPAAEPIGGGLCRLHLRAAKAMDLRPQTILALFLRACAPKDSADDLNTTLDQLCAQGLVTPEIIAAYRAQGCPAVHHSEAFRAAYSPAYRLIPEDCARILPLLARIDALLTEKPFVRISIDGPCGSGKSTLGALVQELYRAALIPMDDFFLPPELRTPERLATPGGNVHYERFFDEVLAQPRGAAIDYRPFNCAVQVVGAPIHIAPNPLLIVEGSYSQHPSLRDGYDLRAVLRVSPEEQSARILRRNGPAMHKRFIEEWIPLENRYFSGCQVYEHADLIL